MAARRRTGSQSYTGALVAILLRNSPAAEASPLGPCGESLTREDVACTLAHSRWARNDSIHGSRWLGHVGLVGSNGPIGRTNVQSGYIDALVNSQIIVTANPNDWEGDSRLGEALASGAVVLVDRIVG